MRTIAAVAAVALLACGRAGPPAVASTDAALVPVAGCPELLAALRARAVADVNARLDRNLELALRGGAGGPLALPAASPAPADGAAVGGAAAWSDTNVQVAGVDEPDFVKTDGRTVYVVAGGRFQVIDAWPAAAAHRVAAVPIDGTPTKLFVAGDRAVVFSSLDAPAARPGLAPPIDTPPRECTYGYDCVPQGDGRRLEVTVLDVADRAAPRVVRRTTFGASLLAARRIGDAIHVVTTLAERPLPGVEEWPVLPPSPSPAQVRAAFAALEATARARILALGLDAWIPAVRDVRHPGEGELVDEGLLASCNGFYASPDADATALLSIASFSLTADAQLQLSSVVGRPGFVHAGAASLHVASSRGPRFTTGLAGADARADTTAIHAFRLGADPVLPRAEYVGSGTVDGHVLSSSSLDVRGDDLRVATSIGHPPDPAVRSAVTVLRPAGGKLAVAGRLDGIAPGEDIRAVRFDGDRGFVVTFKKTDPLFVVDLADPAAPRLAGEVQVPGFSTYLQLLDPAHLLTIGYDADDQGGFAWFRGVELQLFDVADPAHPALAQREVIGTRGSSSAAATNPLAFNYFPARDLLAIPMTRCEGGSPGWTFGDLMTFSGLMVYRVTAAGGFAYVGGVAHQLPETEAAYRSACSSWWTQPSSVVERSVFLEDFVLSFTRAELRIQDTRAMGTDLARIDFTAP